MVAELAGAVAVLIWVYLLLGRGRFWLEFRKRLTGRTRVNAPRVAVVIPARNEASGIGQALASLAGQNYRTPLQIVVVDDGSEDGTADAARGAVPAEMLTVIPGSRCSRAGRGNSGRWSRACAAPRLSSRSICC